MARNDKTTDILKAIADETAAAAGPAEGPADYVDIDGVRYYREPAKAAQFNREKKLYRNPRKPNEAPQEIEIERVAINVAPYADRITLDGVIYLAGQVYEVPVPVAITIREIISRTWQHEASTGGAYSNGATMGVRGSQGQVGHLASGINFG